MREATERESQVWVRDTWSRSFTPNKQSVRTINGTFIQMSDGRMISKRMFFLMFRSMLDMIIADAVIVVLAEDKSNEAVAWAVYDQSNLYYIFVAREFRKQGIGKHMLDTIDHHMPGLHCNFMTEDGAQLCSQRT